MLNPRPICRDMNPTPARRACCRRQRPQQDHLVRPGQFRAGFTLIELLVVISIISLLVAILLPALAKARHRAMEVQCLNQLRQINLASFNYAADNNGLFPNMYGRSLYGISSQKFDNGFGLLTGSYLPGAKRGDDKSSVWICPAEWEATWLNNAPWGWNTSSTSARWRGTYWLPYRTFHPTKPKQARNPSWWYGSSQYYPAMNPDDGPYVWAHDGLISNPGTGNNVGRTTRHAAGYNAVYMDGAGQFFGGTDADAIDVQINAYLTVNYNASWATASRFFDAQRNVGNYASGPS